MLLSDNLGMIKADNGFIFRCILMATNMFHRIFSIMSASLLVVCLLAVPQAWAYKTEKICEDIPATSSVPAHKKCKVVRVKEGGAAKPGDGKTADGKAPAAPAKK
jgi:hypothetical protein